MFANFIYFIVVLLIYATYQPAGSTNFPFTETAGLFLGIVFFFFVIARFLFRRIEKRIGLENPRLLDHRFTTLQMRLSVMAIIIFGIDIYALNLVDFLSEIPFLGSIPTFQAVICMAIFIGYLSIVWGSSHSVYRRLYPSPIDRRGYKQANISFSVPVLLPLLVLSGLTDIIYALPFDSVKTFLSSTPGELFYIFFLMTAIYIIGPAMIQKFWRCKPLSQGPARSRIETLCRKAKVSYRNIVDWPVFGGHMITAGVMGLVRRFRYILVTRALLSHLSPDELDAVIAHEIGHVKKRHLLFYLFFFTGYILIVYGALDIMLYFNPAYLLISPGWFSQSDLAPILSSIVMVASFLIYFRYIFGYFMRNFERQADAYAFSMFGTASPLVSTFQKIAYASGQSADKPNWHHFSLNQRIGFLQRCETDPTLVLRHDRKVIRSILVFSAALIFLAISGYQLNYGTTGKQIRAVFEQKAYQHATQYLNREIEKDPGNPQLLAALGDLYYSRNDFQHAIVTYERALSIKFELPYVLNNLAWLYATCKDVKYRLPQRALLLAKKAAELDPSPETLDTLAESYYINGKYEMAVESESRALELGGQDRSYFEGQLKKFRAAETQ